MRLFKKNPAIEDVDTDLGNTILQELLEEGWVKKREYSRLMFDKGIDYDGYLITDGRFTLDWQWDNWSEWEITGTEDAITHLRERFSLADGEKGRGRMK